MNLRRGGLMMNFIPRVRLTKDGVLPKKLFKMSVAGLVVLAIVVVVPVITPYVAWAEVERLSIVAAFSN
jgi:hypothetical protein